MPIAFTGLQNIHTSLECIRFLLQPEAALQSMQIVLKLQVRMDSGQIRDLHNHSIY